MKKMAKPVKGSARTKKFSSGGTIGALAGIGTLAYLLSRDKDSGDKVTPSGKGVKDDGAGSEVDGVRRAKAASAGRPEMGDGDKDIMNSDKALVRTDGGDVDKPEPKKPAPVSSFSRKNINKPAPAPKNVTKAAPTPPADNDSLPSKPYPIKSKPNEDRPSKTYPINSKPNDERPSKPYPDAVSKPYPINSKPNDERPSKPIPSAVSKPYPITSKPNDDRPSKPYPATKPVAEEKPAEKKPEKKYGIGPYGAFSSVHKAISDTAEARRKARDDRAAAAMKAKAKDGMKKGGKVVKMAKGGMARGDGCAQRGRTKGKMY